MNKPKNLALHYFTLIELLVVIAIIAILASMLMPSLKRALAQSRQISCLSNIKQLNIIVPIYANEYNGYMPITREGNSNYLSWEDVVVQKNYFGTIADMNNDGQKNTREDFTLSFACPVKEDDPWWNIFPATPHKYPVNNPQVWWTYGLNATHFGRDDQWYTGSPKKLSSTKYTTQVLAFGDALLDNFGIIKGNNIRDVGYGYMRYRHEGQRASMSFVDGSAKSESLTENIYDFINAPREYGTDGYQSWSVIPWFDGTYDDVHL